MKKGLLYLLAAATIVLMQNCTGTAHYKARLAAFEEKTRNHRIIAVLPVEVMLSGNQPKHLTSEQIRQIEETESKSFQESLYGALLSYDLRIRILSVDKTNTILENSGVDIRKSWDMSAEDLARMLQVDAVVKTRIEKERLISNLTSAGMEAMKFFFGWAPGSGRTNIVRGSCEILDSDESISLWRMSDDGSTYTGDSPNAVAEDLNNKFARSFPYKKKK